MTKVSMEDLLEREINVDKIDPKNIAQYRSEIGQIEKVIKTETRNNLMITKGRKANND